ncbi:MAG: Dipeptide transport system permease protein DppC, partial [uncultured Thermomicrobiales bacterium]
EPELRVRGASWTRASWADRDGRGGGGDGCPSRDQGALARVRRTAGAWPAPTCPASPPARQAGADRTGGDRHPDPGRRFRRRRRPLRPERDRPLQHHRQPLLGPLAGDRRARAGRAQPIDLRRPRLAAGRCRRRPGLHRDRHRRRGGGRLLRGVGRRDPDAPDRPRPRLPGDLSAADRLRPPRRLRPQRDPLPRPLRLDVAGPDHSRPDPRPQSAGVHRGGPRRRRPGRAADRPPPAAERGRRDHRLDDPEHRDLHAGRGDALLSRLRRSPRDSDLGQHAERCPPQLHDPSAAGDRPRLDPDRRRPGHQLRRRRPPRRLRSQGRAV